MPLPRITMTALFLLLTICFPRISTAQFTLDSTVLDTTTVIDGLDIPWEISWGPDDWIWVTERYGRISRVHPDSGTHEVLLDLSGNVYASGEAGLLGMVTHSDTLDDVHVYIAYTYESGFNVFERLVRYEYEGSQLINPIILLDSIEGNSTHNGSRLIISPDNYLFMTTGDAQDQPSSQDVSSLNGKTLRLRLDGSIPVDNPIPGNPVWSWGHRNAQGLIMAPNGRLYSSEHGPQTDDEFNIIEKGRNYGWPEVHGFCDAPSEGQFCTDSSVIEPLFAWTPTIAPSDIAWYDHPSIPEWRGNILMSVLKDEVLVEIDLNTAGDSVTAVQKHFKDQFGRIRDVCVAPDGRIFIATSGQSWVNIDPFSHKIIEFKNNAYQEDTLTGIAANPVDKSTNLNLYPNPANQFVELSYAQNLEDKRFNIYNALGKSVKKGVLTTGRKHRIDLSGLSTGVYMLVVKTGSQLLAKKLIIRGLE